MSSAAWYTYPRIDNFGQIDPQGNYWKPDSNILVPPGYPVTALLTGLVTSVRRTGFGQEVVTIKLDRPLNGLATHTFYEHMHDATVSPGQHVSAGQLVGHANYAGEGASLGFGLYSGDVYGSGAAWNILQSDLKPGGPGLLNPTVLLNKARSGGLGNLGGTFIGGTTTTTTTTTTGGTTSNSGQSIGTALLAQLGPELQKVGLFLLALVLFGFGIYLLFSRQIDTAVGKGIQAAKVVAT